MSTLDGLLVAGIWIISALATGYPLFCLLRTFGPILRLDWIELAFASILLGSLVIGWIGLLLAEAGLFSLPALAIALALILLLAGLWLWARRASLRPHADVPCRVTWAIILVLVLSAVLFFHPDEFILGGADAGVYVNLGHNIARTGSLLIREDTLTDIPSSLWPGLFRQMPPGSAARYVRFPGFYLSDNTPGLVIPQFLPLHPVWLAIGNSLLGLRASLYVTPLWAALGVMALALALKRAFGERVGLLAAFFLAITSTQIYFARYPTAEPLTQFLIWGGLFAFSAFLTDEHPLWGVLSGLALGQVFLARIDAIPLLLVLLVGLIYAGYRHQWRWYLWFLIPYGMMLLHAAFHALLFSFPYTWEAYGGAWRFGVSILGRAWWLLIGLMLGALALFWAMRRFPVPVIVKSHSTTRWLGVATVIVLGVFAYFVWPQVGRMVMAAYWYGETNIPVQNHLNLVRLGWYLSPLGIGLGIAGMALMFLKGDGKRMWPAMITGLAFSVMYVYNIMNNPFHLYAMRRYVPVVFPFFAAGIAIALTWLWDQRQRWRLAAGAAGALGVVLTGWLAYNDRAVWNMVEFRGFIDQAKALADELEPSAVLLFEDDPPVGAGSTIGTPLQYLHGFTAFDLQEKYINPVALAEQIADWQAAGRAVYWIMGPQLSGNPFSLSLTPVREVQFHLPRLEQSYDHFPVRHEELLIPVDVYKLQSDCPLPVKVDIGALDGPYVRSGFHDREKLAGVSVRWTTGEAGVEIPCLPTRVPETFSLAVRVSPGRSVGLPPVRLSFAVDGKSIGEWTLKRDFQVVETRVPGALLQGSGHTLTLRSDTWVPQQHGVNSDPRTLGVLVDWIAISDEQP